MAKVTRYSRWRVEVEIDASYCDEQDALIMLQVGNDLIKSIKRHVDDIGHMHVLHDTTYICSHCGSEWEEWTAEDERLDPENIAGCPTCCAKAIEEWEQERRAKEDSK